jgi:hypothetical protein
MELDREQLDRVIRRATELQFAGAEREGRERLSEDEVLRIGREVGLDPAHVRRALGELRADALLPRQAEERGLVSRFVGQPRVVASRAVPGRSTEVIRILERYLSAGESLRQVRKRDRRSRWEAEEGVVASIQRSLRWGGRTYELARAAFVDMNVEDLEEGFSLVTLAADLSPTRSNAAWGWTTGVTTGAAGAGLGIGLAVGFPFLAAPAAVAGLAGGVAAARKDHARTSERMRLALEGILDRLEAGEPLLAPGPSWRDRLARP